MKPKDGHKGVNYLVTYFLIAFAGIPFFDGNKPARAVFFIVLAALFIYYNNKLNKSILVVIALTAGIVFAQLVLWGGSLVTILTILALLVLSPYFGIKIVGPQIIKYYRNIMYVSAIIALVFWLATNFVPGFHALVLKIGIFIWPLTPWPFPESIIVYNYEEAQVYGFYRNPGPFHEPGAYSVFLMLAIISEIFIEKKLGTKKNILFFISIATTFSTAGYLGLFVILGFYVFMSKRLTLLTKYVISFAMIGILVFMFTQIEFLGDKITSQMKEQTEASLNEETSGRFLGARKALISLWKNPITGRGFLAASKADLDSAEAAGYGWITWVSQLGIIFGPLYLYFFYKTFRYYSLVNLGKGLFGFFAFLAMLAVLAGQKHTSALIFYGLFLMTITFPIQKYYHNYYLNAK